jgi:hypothetical protein
MTHVEVEFSLTPKQVAEAFWALDSVKQAEMMQHLYEIAGEYKLMMQGMYLRDDCIARGDDSLAAFQTLFASAFKYAGEHC